MTEFLHIAPWALLTSVVGLVGLTIALWAARRRTGLSMALVVVVPLIVALGFVVAISRFMFTEQLGWTLITCLLIGVVLAPGSWIIGRQFARRTLAIEMKRAEERAREQTQRDLIAWMSHDLRTPLAGIRAMAEALADQVVERPDDVQRYGTRIESESMRLAGMVDDLFELSRIDTGGLELDLRPIALHDVAREVADGLRPVAAGRGIDLEVDFPDDVVAFGSGAELVRIVQNLMNNALRHTEAGRSIRVQGGTDGDQVWVGVTDGCGGIPAAELGRVFEVGFRGSVTGSTQGERLSPGAGLGLAIVKGLVAAQGGSVSVRNVDQGCCFLVRLPAPALVGSLR